MVLVVESIPSSNDVALNPSYYWECTKTGLIMQDLALLQFALLPGDSNVVLCLGLSWLLVGNSDIVPEKNHIRVFSFIMFYPPSFQAGRQFVGDCASMIPLAYMVDFGIGTVFKVFNKASLESKVFSWVWSVPCDSYVFPFWL